MLVYFSSNFVISSTYSLCMVSLGFVLLQNYITRGRAMDVPLALPLSCLNSDNANKKELRNPLDSEVLWQRVKDSNPHIQSQSLLCYHYTNPLYLFSSFCSFVFLTEQILLYIFFAFCQHFFQIFFIFYFLNHFLHKSIIFLGFVNLLIPFNALSCR